jgi:mercuric ion transport protein
MSETPLVEPGKGRGVLAAGGIAAILASACCLGPLLLVALGFSGAWIGNLTVLEPYRPIFIGAALDRAVLRMATHLPSSPRLRAGRRVRRPQVRTAYKVIFWIVAALVLVALAFPYVCRCSTERKIIMKKLAFWPRSHHPERNPPGPPPGPSRCRCLA